MTAVPAPAPAPASPAEALAMIRSGLGYLAASDTAQLPAEAQAEILIGLQRAEAIATAVHAWCLGSFAGQHGYSADADYSACAWLIHKGKMTRGAARGYLAWARRAVEHPEVVGALAEGAVLTASVARAVCGWTDRLPQECRQAADEILVAAARAGADEETLAALAAEIYARSRAGDGDGPDDGFEDRSVRLETTFDGAGVIRGNLTPQCAAAVAAVLDALAAPAGADDTRTRDQRWHDALEDGMRSL